MSITTKIITSLDIVLNYINKDLYKNIDDYCFLETSRSNFEVSDDMVIGKMVANDGSLVSILRIDGIKKVVSKRETITTVEDLNKKIKSSFKEKGHMMQFFFTKDKERTKQEIERLMRPYKNESIKNGANAGFIFDEKVDYLSDECCYEDNLLVLWSRPSLIDNQKKQENEDLVNELNKYPLFTKGQNILLNYESLENKHDAFINNILDSFKVAGISVSGLCIKEQTNKIKSSINYELTHSEWSARNVLSKKPVIRDHEDTHIKENDISYMLYPNLRKQLIPCDFESEDSKTIKIDDYFTSSMYIDIPQEDITPFSELVESLGDDIPYQISFKIEGGGLSGMGLKKFLSSILIWSPGSSNKEIKESLDYYAQKEKEGIVVTKNNISVNTWSKDFQKLKENRTIMMKTLESWGTMKPMFPNGDIFESYFNSIPAFNPTMSGNSFVDCLEDILYTLPLSRQANIWDYGSIINKTKDGKIMPYQVASEMQASWNEIIFAKPGSGKSVWSNYTNWSFVNTPKSGKLSSGKLPFLGILDIGPSSYGLIKLLKMVYPDSMSNQFIYHKLQNEKDDGINPFDTQHGCRVPNSKEREFLIGFLSLLLTPAGEKMPSGIDAMISAVINETYKDLHDKKSPKDYDKYENNEIENKLRSLGVDATNRSWWWVVDKLFEKNEHKLSKDAQKYAVPVLEDLVKVANSTESIKTPYTKTIVSSTKESLLDYFNRTISEVIRDYPILSTVTKLDLSSSRIVSLDLNDVAPEGSAAAEKQSSIFYMLGRFVVTRNFFVSQQSFKFAPQKYEKYLKEKALEHYETPKRLCVDELHRTSNIKSFKEQIERDMREGRKWKLSICLISQLLNDFTDDMIDLSNSKFVLSGGDNYREIVNKFDLSGEVEDIVRKDLNGPTHLGVPFIAKYTTKTGDYTQFLYSSLSPIERWCFSSTTEDVSLLQMMELSFSTVDTYKILGKTFPSGTVTKHIAKMQNDPKLSDIGSPLEYIVEKIKKQNKDLILI